MSMISAQEFRIFAFKAWAQAEGAPDAVWQILRSDAAALLDALEAEHAAASRDYTDAEKFNVADKVWLTREQWERLRKAAGQREGCTFNAVVDALEKD